MSCTPARDIATPGCASGAGLGARNTARPPPCARGARADRHHPTRRAAGERLVGLDGQRQTLLLAMDDQDMHALDAEQLIGPDTPTRAAPTRTVMHVGVFSSGSLVAPGREGPDSLPTSRHAVTPHADAAHAQIRRAMKGVESKVGYPYRRLFWPSMARAHLGILP